MKAIGSVIYDQFLSEDTSPNSIGPLCPNEEFIPVLHDVRLALNAGQNKRFGSAVFHMTMAFLDVFMVKSLITSGTKLALAGGGKLFGNEVGALARAGGKGLVAELGEGAGKINRGDTFVFNATKIKGGEALSEAELKKIVDGLRAQRVEVILGEEAARRAESVGAKALYIPSGGYPGQIVLPPGVTRVQVLEELHHFTQSRVRGFPNRSIMTESQRANANIVTEFMELEAKDKLILHGQRSGWHKSVIKELEEARAIHLENLKKHLPNPPKGIDEVRGWDTSVIDDYLRLLNP